VTPRTNRYDVYRIQNVHLGVAREAFDRVVNLSGFQLRPTDQPYLWDFRHSHGGERGRLLHVEGFLGGTSIALLPGSQAYLVEHKGKTRGLLFPPTPKRMRVNYEAHRVVPLEKLKGFPSHWPKQLVSKVLRVRIRDLVLLDQAFLLDITLRKQPAA